MKKRLLALFLSVLMIMSVIHIIPALAADGQEETVLYHRGVNMSCAESGSWDSSVYGTNYAYCPESAYKYFCAKGQTIFRLPVLWERVQPQLGGELDELNLSMIKSSADWAAKYGGQIILDIHNYGKYQSAEMNTASGPTVEDFCDLWVRLSNELKDHPGVYAYDLMNEPLMGSAVSWEECSQAAVDAIRANGDNTLIWVEGNSWSSAQRWPDVNNGGNGPWIDDPADNICYSAHIYFDRDASGTYSRSYETELADYIESNSTETYTATEEDFIRSVTVDRVKPFVDWCEKWGTEGSIGEYGAPHRNDGKDYYTSGTDNYPGEYDTKWVNVVNTFMDYMDEVRMDTTMWSAGYWWGHTKLNIYPVDQYSSGDYQVDSVMTKGVINQHPTEYGIDDRPVEYMTVTFDSMGGTSVEPQTVKKGRKITEPEQPVKEGTHFLGWYMGENSRDEWDFENDRLIENITLYAKWGIPTISKEWTAEEKAAAVIESNMFNDPGNLFDGDIESGASSTGASKTWTDYTFTIDLGRSYDIEEYVLYGGNYLEDSGLSDPYEYNIWGEWENGDHLTRRMPMGWEIYYRNYEESSWRHLETVSNTSSMYTGTKPFTARYIKYVQTANFGNYCEWGSIREFELKGFAHEGVYIESEEVYYKDSEGPRYVTDGWSDSMRSEALIESNGFNNAARLFNGRTDDEAGSTGTKVWENYNFTLDLGEVYGITGYDLYGGYYLEDKGLADPYEYDVWGQWENGDNLTRRMPTAWNIYYKLDENDEWTLLEEVRENTSSVYSSSLPFVARYIKYEQAGNFGYYCEWGCIRELLLYGEKAPVPLSSSKVDVSSVRLMDNTVNMEVLNSSYLPLNPMTLSANVKNTQKEDVNIKTTIAIYNKHNELIAIETLDKVIAPGQTAVYEIPIQIIDDAVSDSYSAKVFFWESDTNKPMTLPCIYTRP